VSICARWSNDILFPFKKFIRTPLFKHAATLNATKTCA
jgi:hypothetical protein